MFDIGIRKSHAGIGTDEESKWQYTCQEFYFKNKF